MGELSPVHTQSFYYTVRDCCESQLVIPKHKKNKKKLNVLNKFLHVINVKIFRALSGLFHVAYLSSLLLYRL